MNQQMKNWGRRVLVSANAVGLCLGAIGCSSSTRILEPRATDKGSVPAPYLSPTTGSKHKGSLVDPFSHSRVALPSPILPEPSKAPSQIHRPIVGLPEIPKGEPTRIVRAPELPTVTVQPITYQVRKGDSLSKIAVMHKVSVDEIASVNKMRKSDTLHIGRILTMPPGAVKPSRDSMTTSRPSVQGEPRYHIVKDGEILSRIALQYDVGVQDLVAWNNLSSANKIYKGQRIAVNAAGAGGVPGSSNRSTTTTTRRVKRPIPASGIHKVDKNESWWSIAHSYQGLDSRELQEINSPKTTLHPGDIVYLTRAAAGQRVSTKTAQITGEPVARPLPSGNVYTVKPGDTMSGIAAMFGKTIRELRSLNNRDSDRLIAGETLVITQTTDVASTRPQVTSDKNEVLVRPNTKDTPLVGTTDVANKNFTMLPHFVDQSSDTLEEIAEMYGSRVKWILDANPAIKGNSDLRKVKEISVPVEDLNLSGQ